MRLALVSSIIVLLCSCSDKMAKEAKTDADYALYIANSAMSKASSCEEKVDDLESKISELEFRLDVNDIH